MNHFQAALTILLKEHSAIDIAEATDLTPTTISRIKNGKTDMSQNAFEKLVGAFPQTSEKWSLVKARILDVTPYPFDHTVKSALETEDVEMSVDYSGNHRWRYRDEKELTDACNTLYSLGFFNSELHQMIVSLAKHLKGTVEMKPTHEEVYETAKKSQSPQQDT